MWRRGGIDMLRIAAYFKSYIPQIIFLLLCYLATAALNLVWPYLNGTILYDKILGKDSSFLAKIGLEKDSFVLGLLFVVLTMVVTKLTTQIISILQGIVSNTITPKVIAKMKTTIFESMGRLSLNFFNSSQTGSLMTRVLSDADRVTDFFTSVLPYFITNIFTIISTCIIMFSMNVALSAASLCLLPVLALLSVKMLPQLFHLFGKRHRAERNMNSQINDNITGSRVVKAFGREQSEIEHFDKYNKNVGASEMHIVKFDNRFNSIYTFVENAASLAVWGIGAYLVLYTSNIEMGMLITFSSYVTQLKEPLDFFSRAMRLYTDSKNSAQRMFEIIDAKPEVVEKENPTDYEIKKGEIEIKNLTFGYDPSQPVLNNLNLQIDGGRMLGIVGRSGAGKSTLVSLISRLYDPQEGEILIDGINIKDMAFKDLRQNIAMVSQETYIFMGTVAENIAYAKPDASRDEIIQAARLASAHDFICSFPDGYDTVIGSSGKSLSGGERQRLSIARAILANPKILILDEATASVDTETEKAIQKSLLYLVKNRTTLSIAHRLSTLRNADKLIVIDNGTIIEQGTHSQLVGKRGTYFKLVELQTKALAMKGIE